MDDVRFNPFSGKLELDGAVLDTPDGQPALRAEHIALNLAIRASLKYRNLIADGIAHGADIRINLDTKGSSNWTQLIGEAEDVSSAAIPFAIGQFSIKNSTLEFHDEGSNVVLNVAGMDADLYDLGPDLRRPARLELKGSSGARGRFEGTAALILSPVDINADFHTENLELMPIAAYLEDAGIVLKKGMLNGDLAFEYKSLDDRSVFSLKKSKLSGKDIQWRMGTDRAVDIQVGEVHVDELEYDGTKSTLSIGKAHLDVVSAAGPEGVGVRIGGADMGQLSVDFSDFAVQADSAGVNSTEVTKDDESGRIEMAISNIRSHGLGFRDGQVSVAGLEADRIVLQDFSDADGAPRELSFGKVSVQGGVGDIGKRLLSAEKFDSSDATIQAWIAAKGIVGMPGYAGIETAGWQSRPSKETWAVSLDEALIRNYRVRLVDRSIDPPASLDLADLDIRLTGLNTRQGKFALRLESSVGRRGKMTVEGTGRVDPPEADLHLRMQGIGLRPFRPYLNGLARIDLAKGRLNLEGDLAYRPVRGDTRFSGTAEIAGLVTFDKREGRHFVNWRSLRADELTLETAANRLSIRELIADKPYLRVVVSPERTLNLIENLFQPEPKTDMPRRAAVGERDGRPLAVTVGSLLVREGSADFSDLSLQPNVSVDIHGLSGFIRSLSSKPDAKAEVSIRGSISDASPVTISGRINPFQIGTFADIRMRFANVDLTELSPYSAKFAGYRIDRGKLDLDLHYQLSDRKLVADNNMVFDHLTLGERVESPNATSLPVKLAVSLMRGFDGKIDIDLPISGNLDDPNFSIGGLLAKAAVGVITKVVGSPFSAVGMLLDGGSDDAGSIRFATGSSSLEDPEKAKLDALAKALSDRSGLNLEIRGTARTGKDASALAEQQLRRQLENAKAIELRIGGGDQDRGPAGPVVLSDEDYHRLFSQFYRMRYPGASEWAELPKGERVLSRALFESARRKVLKDWTIGEIDLRRLAQARAAGIRSYLMQKGIEPNRIYLLDVYLSADDGDTVALLSLS
ncbi:DUF748 domain-containing protein [Methylococcus geothermalis]|uniref:DUF748 domain-containing protein n=2 Tax=Methylococcus geothermalis TaxID=2681310 RepID=A0A858QBY7_9GAMM|nr:DUF748 domain-containing protein [Methylococcus geothermalis]